MSDQENGRVSVRIYEGEHPEVTSISVKVMYEFEDKREIVHTLQMDPQDFQMEQSREVRPVYDTRSYLDFGRPVDMAVDPDRKGTQLLIKGVVREGRVWRNWG